MAKSDDRKKYEALVAQGERSGKIDVAEGGEERREHPRFKFDRPELLIDVRLRVSVINISRSGVTFYSNYRFEHGSRLTVNIGAVFSLESEVVTCEMQEYDADLLEIRYSIRAKFVEEELDLPKLLTVIDR